MSADGVFHVTAAGHRLFSKRIGEWQGDEPVLVFLHEGLGSTSQWHGFPAALASACGLPALVYDRYGYGGSDPLDGPRPSNFIELEALEALPAVLDACGVARPVLFGHSDGGTIALIYASAFPERPVACITEAAHVLLEDRTHGALMRLRERWEIDDAFRIRLARHHGAHTDATFRGWAEAWTRPDNREWNMLDRLPAIRCPVLAIQGADDEHGTLLQVDEIAGRVSGPVTVLMIPDCGHIPHREGEGVVLEKVTGFVRRVLGPGASATQGATAG